MLFDLEPKSRKEDLFDFDYELRSLVSAIRSSRLTLVTGLRRTGKTSLLRVALNEAGLPFMYMDVRLSLYSNYRDLAELFRKALMDLLLRESSLIDRIVEVLRGVGGIEVSLKPLTVHVRFRGRGRFSIPELFVRLNDIGEPIVVAIDEAQELRKVNWLRFDRFFAYVFDNLSNIRLVLTGSQVGLLHGFLGIDDPRAPLFGRVFTEVRTRRLSPDESLEFLERGFGEVGVRVPREVMERAVDLFDGIIGWLVYFGHEYSRSGSVDLDEIVGRAVGLALEELRNLMRELRSERYAVILRSLASGPMPWGLIKRRVEDHEGRELNPATISQLLNNLVWLGIVERRDGDYVISDPVYRLAASRL